MIRRCCGVFASLAPFCETLDLLSYLLSYLLTDHAASDFCSNSPHVSRRWSAQVERFVTVDRDSGVVRAAVSLDRELVSELNVQSPR